VYLLVGFAVMQGLGVSINGHKINSSYTGIYHPVDGRAAGAADSDYFDAGERFYCWVDFGHFSSLRINYLIISRMMF
jgi:hypothetical protein